MSRTPPVLLAACLSFSLLACGGRTGLSLRDSAAGRGGSDDVDTAGTTGSPAGSGGSTGKGGSGGGGSAGQGGATSGASGMAGKGGAGQGGAGQGGAGMSGAGAGGAGSGGAGAGGAGAGGAGAGGAGQGGVAGSAVPGGASGSSGQSGTGGSPTCSDGVQNGAETGLDCGGPDCPPCVTESGCADGTRESFLDETTYTRLAACSGGWSIAGTKTSQSLAPACAHSSGNSSTNPEGLGCTVADLCAVGWHVCSDADDVLASSPPGQFDPCGQVAMMAQPLFFTTRQSGPGNNVCASTGANDLFGCGNIGYANPGSCFPLNQGSNNQCSDLGWPWQCGFNGEQESLNVTKGSAARGGALCCKD